MKFLIATLILLNLGCGSATLASQYSGAHVNSPPETEQYLQDYVDFIGPIGNQRGTIEFGVDKGGAIARCYTSGDSPWKIVIDTAYWEIYKDQRLQIMYHEFTHCILGVGHIDTPNSFMNPRINDEVKNKAQLELELLDILKTLE
jgi:hypothetical protein